MNQFAYEIIKVAKQIISRDMTGTMIALGNLSQESKLKEAQHVIKDLVPSRLKVVRDFHCSVAQIPGSYDYDILIDYCHKVADVVKGISLSVQDLQLFGGRWGSAFVLECRQNSKFNKAYNLLDNYFDIKKFSSVRPHISLAHTKHRVNKIKKAELQEEIFDDIGYPKVSPKTVDLYGPGFNVMDSVKASVPKLVKVASIEILHKT